MKYAWVKNEDDTIIKFQDYDDSWSPNIVSHKFGVDFAVRIIPFEIDDDLPVDSSVEKQIIERQVTITKVRDKKTVVNLSSEELAEKADLLNRSDKLRGVVGKIDTLRSWAEQARGVTVSEGNAIVVIQQIVNNLEKFYDAFADLIEGRGYDR